MSGQLAISRRDICGESVNTLLGQEAIGIPIQGSPKAGQGEKQESKEVLYLVIIDQKIPP